MRGPHLRRAGTWTVSLAMDERMPRLMALISQAMRVRGLTKWRELAERTPNIDASRYTKWKGTRNNPPAGEPSASQLQEIARALDMTVSELIGETKTPTPQLGDWKVGVYEALSTLTASTSRLVMLAERLERVDRELRETGQNRGALIADINEPPEAPAKTKTASTKRRSG
jgi:transcriptional regulator with XRE-family HTH domain